MSSSLVSLSLDCAPTSPNPDAQTFHFKIKGFLSKFSPRSTMAAAAAAAAATNRSPEIITEKSQMRSWSRSKKSQSKTLALVPTMGFLHEGHLSLIRQAQAHADLTVVSIYVNPGQFAPTEDLSTYPSDFAGDLRKLTELGGVDAVFCPKNLYDYGGGRSDPQPEGGGGQTMVSCVESGGDGGGLEHETWIRVERLEKGLCGKSRPVFFRGVATIVAKLFNIVEPDFSVFGKKDYQQWRVVCRMVRFEVLTL